MHLTTWAAFTLAYTLMAFTPGPVIMLVISYALTQGRRTALAIVVGTTLGDATSLTAAVLGVGALLEASALSFTILKLAGAAYLVFLGVKLWRQKVEGRPTPETNAPAPLLSLRKAFVHAYLSTTLNPKSVLFFMVFVPQFLDPAAPLWPQLAAMLASVGVFGALVDGGYSLFAAKIGGYLQGRRARRALNRVAGSVLIGEGAFAATWRGLSL
jgi:threonine/homoserine/homoserine lactone efflux protein